ncbi:MAG: cardiolipin synthase ClsB [Betaproteobacteria bacterium]|nr:cardiolipin synthase ClsB [Betaproteobacteria bacterium]
MKPDWTPGNRLQLLCTGSEYFPALEAAIRAARVEFHLETYIYEDDDTGRRITAALCDAAGRGVAVHVMVDGFGAKDMHDFLKRQLREAGVRLLVFRPKISPLTLKRERLRRLHRKLVVADASVAFVGGINIIDDMHTPGQIPPRYDYAVRIEGPLVPAIHDSMLRLWNSVAWGHGSPGLIHRPDIAPDGTPRGTQRAALVVRDNFRHRSDIEDVYLAAIDAARDEIIIANAYFFPGRRFRQALVRAAARDVRVVLLLQGRVEYLLLHHASRALYGTLLEAGVEIHEYHKSFLHAKVAVIDGHWATVGSSNIDPFSLFLAREANVVVDDRGFAAELRVSLHRAMEEGALHVAREHWFRQPLWKRLPIWISYGVVRFLMGVVGYAREL